MYSGKNVIPSFDNHIKLSFPQSSLVTPLSLPLSNSPSVNFKTDAIFNEHILHSPTSARLTLQDLNNIDLETHFQYIKYLNLPFFSNKNFQPFPHCPTIKETPLTTRLLYPKTTLPSTFLSSDFPVMSVFKNRLHGTNAISKLFADVKIDDLTLDSVQILHQQVSSMALKPVLPGYHLEEPLSLSDMQPDLTVIFSHHEDEIILEKTLTQDDKIKKDKNYVAIVEIARSLLPKKRV